jgi:hypothetical protein
MPLGHNGFLCWKSSKSGSQQMAVAATSNQAPTTPVLQFPTVLPLPK